MAFSIKDIDDSKAPLLDHLIELRTRLMRSILALMAAFGVCLYFADPILGFLIKPLRDAFPAGEGQLIFTKLPEVFFVELKVALFAGFMISFPIIANQLWAFIAPGLYANEKKAFLPFLIATPVLFLGGASLAYYVVMPIAFLFFLGYGGTTGGLEIKALPAAGDYLDTVMQFILAFGLTFLLPVLLMLLHRAGIVTREQLVGARRYVIVGVVALAAVVTPPDPGSQLILAIPLLVLFEGSLLLMRFQDRNRKAPEGESRRTADTTASDSSTAGPSVADPTASESKPPPQ